MMQYKGYTGVFEVDVEAEILYGRVIGLRDMITFQGTTVAETRQAFEESVDDYLNWCAERGKPPEKSYSGKILVRLKPETHRALARIAEVQRKSLNSIVEEVLAAGLLRHELAITNGLSTELTAVCESILGVSPPQDRREYAMGTTAMMGTIVEVDPPDKLPRAGRATRAKSADRRG
jgi:predicted HicB family RNase H-like nuclease